MKKALFLLILSLTLSACLKKQDQSPSDTLVNTNPTSVQQEVSGDSYEQDLQKVLQSFWDNENSTGIKDQILQLRVPAEYLGLHFDLVIAFEMLEQGAKSADQGQVEDGLDKIEQLVQEYSWLK